MSFDNARGNWTRLAAWSSCGGAFSASDPRRAFREVRVALHEVHGTGTVVLSFDDYRIEIAGPASGVSRCSRTPRVLYATGISLRPDSASFEIECLREGGRISVIISGREYFSCLDPLPHEPVAKIIIHLAEEVSCREIAVDIRGAVEAFQPFFNKAASLRHVDICIDFYDDLLYAPWGHKTFESAMRFFKERGFRRVYFVDHFDRASGWWDQAAVNPGLQRNIDRTFDEVGDFLTAATEHAHAQGLELYSVIKPFESALFYTLPDGSPEALRYGKIKGLGGWHWWAPNFIARHPEIRIARNPRTSEMVRTETQVRTVILVAEPGSRPDLESGRLTIWVSPDNGSYKPYSGPVTIQTEVAPGGFRMVFDGLEIPERYLALTVDEVAEGRFGNLLRHVVEVRDQNRKRPPITFSMRGNPPSHDFRINGFAMDVSGFDGRTKELDDFFLFHRGRVLGMALGSESHLQGALCPSEPLAREWWMRQIDRSICAGVDGIDFRIKNHNRTFDWDAYGFNQPLAEAFRERFDIDIRKEDFDRSDWRRLRGEFFTAFLVSARDRLKEEGRAMHLHVEPGMNEPSWHSVMETHFDWPAWIANGLADGITLKMIPEMGSFMARRVTELADRHGHLAVSFNPSLHGLNDVSRQRDDLLSMVDDAAGCESFIIYENALIMAAQGDGSISITKPWIVDAIFERFV